MALGHARRRPIELLEILRLSLHINYKLKSNNDNAASYAIKQNFYSVLFHPKIYKFRRCKHKMYTKISKKHTIVFSKISVKIKR